MNPHPFFSLLDNLSEWQVFASGQAVGKLSKTTDTPGNAGIRLDYDFHGGGGFVAIRRVFHFNLPEAFEIGFHMRGEGPQNHFEFKVAGPSGANVWRHLNPDFRLPDAWTDHRFHERSLLFAWGPAGGGAPSEIEAVEFVIAAGPGGKGVLELASPSFEDQTSGKPLEIRASSHQRGFAPGAVFEADSLTGWRAAHSDSAPRWSVDFGRPLRFGGFVIRWPELLPPRAFELEVSTDGETWTHVYRAVSAYGSITHISAPGGEARYLRVTFANAECAAFLSFTLRPDAFSHTPNEFIHSVAADYPRGWFPRYWLREQSYWTPVGSQEGRRRALINEEGMVEVDEAGFSLEPFLEIEGKPVTRADVESSCALPMGGAPLPSVIWKAAGMWLEILPWINGKGDDLTLHVTYRLKCNAPATNVRMLVTVRPFQVNPPWQAFRNLGGCSPIHRIGCSPDGMTVNLRDVSATPAPDTCGASAFEEGGVLLFLTSSKAPTRSEVDDACGLASGVMTWNVPSGKSTMEVTVSVPYFGEISKSSNKGRSKALAAWRKTLGKVRWHVPGCAVPAFDCFRTAAAHILINRDGPAIQPGPRRYTRSWVRDCVIMGAALAKAGLPKPLREFLTWYAQFQREDGFIPCVVDRDGIDWLVEHDSHGQFLWGIREVIRESGDQQFLKTMYPRVLAAANYLIAIRAKRMTKEYAAGEHSACFGLLPESASHEGYLAHPVHSYWDDFWGIRGLEAAADLAAAMNLTDDSTRWKSEADHFQADTLCSIIKVIAGKNLNYIPGSVEWADFDPTATSNAIAMLDFADALPDGPLHAMLETYLDGFRRKHRGEMVWNNYTAYEIRIIGAFVRLGNRDVANELLNFFLSDRRPLEWNQWPEITWRDPRSPGHLGDVPHTWIAAEYLLALASMVVAERDATASVVLASGMPWTWISEENEFSVSNLPTRYGPLDFLIHASSSDSIRVEIGGKMTMPPGGLAIMPPLPNGKRIIAIESVQEHHAAIESTKTSIAVSCLPFVADLRLSSVSQLV
ncbi:MAG: discoidin domain-containing protein [Gloeobacteraceae cyanobacterium ES-bin-144]|nr:discoidin domain-containing protein [Verrucomicrobiales bacterium]